MYKKAIKVFKWITGTVVLLSVMAAIAVSLSVSWLANEQGRIWIAEQIEQHASTTEYTIDIGQIKTLNTALIEVNSLDLRDQSGEIGQIKNLRLEYDWKSFLIGRPHIRNFYIEDISVQRIPDQEQSTKQEKEPFELPIIRIDTFEIETIRIAEFLTGKTETLSLTGNASIPKSLSKSVLKIHLLDKTSDTPIIDLHANLVNKRNPTLRAIIKDEGTGLISRLSGLSNIDISLKQANGNTPAVLLERMSITHGIYDVNLQNPAEITLKDDGLNFKDMTVTFNGGTLKASGAFTPKHFNATVVAENISTNFQTYPLEFDGMFGGNISLSGTYDKPEGNAQLTLKHIAIPGLKDAKDRYVDGVLNTTLKGSKLRVDTDLKGPANLHFKGNASLPVSFSPLTIPTNQPINLELKSSVDLRALTILLGLDEHRASGRTALDIVLSGTLDQPKLQGTGSLSDGAYENIVIGTVLQNISAAISAEKNVLRLTNVVGQDKNGGRFKGSGQIEFQNLQNPHYSFSLDTDKLQLVSTDNMGLIASGTVNSKGDSHKANIDGNISINQAEYFLNDIVDTSSLGTYEIIEINSGRSPNSSDDASLAGPDIYMDIGIKAKNSIFVRSPDMDTEWKADLKVSGTAQDPNLKGKMSLIRGHLLVLDTLVDFSEGDINFVNTDPSNPVVNITGSIKGKEATATLKIEGEASDPEINLSSEPPLPEDEILAKTLFGKSASQISPVQALRIARFMAYLSGRKEAGFDPLNQIRRAIGIDRLSVGLDDDQGATLSAGKYINDRVYIGIDQGATPESSAVRAEIEVTDDIDVETVTGNGGESSLGVNWKRDY